jgi:transposase
MTLVTLSPKEWEALATLAASTTDAQLLRRAPALLWLDEGETVPEIAARLRVSRQAGSKGVVSCRTCRTAAMTARLAPGTRRGRPRTGPGVSAPLILAVSDRDPRALGSRSTVWTAPRLGPALQEGPHLTASRPSVGLAIARLGWRWKRPRHALARRPAPWRQAKGGSKAALRRASAPSS